MGLPPHGGCQRPPWLGRCIALKAGMCVPVHEIIFAYERSGDPSGGGESQVTVAREDGSFFFALPQQTLKSFRLGVCWDGVWQARWFEAGTRTFGKLLQQR